MRTPHVRGPRMNAASAYSEWDEVSMLPLLSSYTRCPFRKYTASSCSLASFPRKRESRGQGYQDWMPACAGMTLYWRQTYETDI